MHSFTPSPPDGATDSPGAEALARVWPWLEAVQPHKRVPRRARVAQAVVGARRVVQRIEQLGLVDELRDLPRRHFDLEDFARFSELSEALGYLDLRVRLSRAGARDTAIPASLLEEADALRDRLKRLLEFHLRDRDVTITRQLAYLRRIGGHRGRVDALHGYADLYVAHADELVHYPAPHNEPQDVNRARRVADTLDARRSDLTKEDLRAWKELLDRAWTAWIRCYDRIRRAARFVLGERQEAEELLSATTLGRRPARRRRVEEPSPEDVVEAEVVAVEERPPPAGQRLLSPPVLPPSPRSGPTGGPAP